jgi:hypothetical protein
MSEVLAPTPTRTTVVRRFNNGAVRSRELCPQASAGSGVVTPSVSSGRKVYHQILCATHDDKPTPSPDPTTHLPDKSRILSLGLGFYILRDLTQIYTVLL